MKDYYRLLNIKPDASDYEIRAAFERLKRVFDKNNPSLYSIYNEKKVQEIINELREAFIVLTDHTKRKEYNEMLIKEGVYSASALRVSGVSHELEGSTELSEIPPDLEAVEEGSGPYLKAHREKAGISLREVTEETKIQKSFLRAIEEENFRELPARVFVRGFIVAYVKVLKIPEGERVVEEYMKRYDEAMKGEK